MFTPRLFPALLALAAAPALAEPLPNFDAYESAPAATPVRAANLPPGFVRGVDAQRGVPTLLLAPHSDALAGAPALGSTESAARFWLAQQAPRYGLSATALETVELRRVVDTGRGGILVAFGQRVNGIEIYRSELKVLLDRQLQLVALGGELQPTSATAGKAGAFRLPADRAVGGALRDLYGFVPPLEKLDRTQDAYDFYALAPSANALRFVEPARVKPVYYAMPDGLVPAYFVELLAQSAPGAAPDAYDYVLAANDLHLLHRENLTHAAFSYRVFAEGAGDHRPFDGPIVDYTPHPTGTPDGSYPAYASPNLISIDGFNAPHDPWLAPGATVTQGNNVDAYTDDDNPDGFSAGDIRASVSSPGTFDYTFDLNQDPQANTTQKMAAVTDLFYVTNWLHDWWYDSGFTETAANAQQSNYGRGGVEGDPLHAEAQDGAPTTRNNSNMLAMTDGTSPRMQMYVWDGRSNASLTVQPLNLTPQVGVAGFGPTAFSVSGTLVRANDGSGTTTDACQALTNNVSGQVVVVDRGTCSFKTKALNVQTAGGVGMVLVDNQTQASPPAMGDDTSITTPITIGVLSVTLADGTSIINAMQGATQTASLTRSSTPTLDGTLDNSVIAHEWGHYLHLRQVSCSSQQCMAESEGWGDFTAMQMVLRAGDDLAGTYALAQYASGGLSSDPAYFGIRRFPYSTNLSKNPLTFIDISDGQALPTTAPINQAMAGGANSEVHDAGEIWAQMLFEGFAAILGESQGTSPRFTFDEARRRMSDYVELALQLAPVDPTYTEQRDALIAAASASDTQDALLLAQAFAKRGAGSCAVSPDRASTNLTGVVEDFSLSSALQLVSATLDDSVSSCDHDGVLDANEQGLLTITLANSGGAPWSGSVSVSSSSAGVTFPSGTSASFSSIGVGEQRSATLPVALAAGTSGIQNLAFQLTANPAASCDGGSTWSTDALANYDLVLNASASDDVESPVTAWTPSGTDSASIWSRQLIGSDHAWLGVDFGSPSDTALVSPPLAVGTGPLSLAFDTRYQFEQSSGVNWDGAVIEVSTDDGGTWGDISQYGNPGYGGTIGDPQGQATNVLMGRQGYVGQNASWPSRDHLSIDLGTALAGKTIRIRFRIGTDDAQGAYGWELDNFALGGLTNLPFPKLLANAGVCTTPDAGSPIPDAGPSDAGFVGLDAGAPDAGGSTTTSTSGTTGTSTTGTGTSTSTSSGSTSSGSTTGTSTSSGSTSSGSTTGTTTTSTSTSSGSTSSGSTTGTTTTGTSSSTTTTGGSTTGGSTSSGTTSSSTSTGGSSSTGGTLPSHPDGGAGGKAAGGGCGCSAEGGSGFGALLPFMAIGLAYLARRRRFVR